MRHISLLPVLIGLLVFPTLSSAQINFFPEGAEWHYAFRNFGFQSRGYITYQYSHDTVIATQPVHILKRTIYHVDHDDPTIHLDTIVLPPMYATQQGDTILYYTQGTFQILWRVTPQAGDFFQFEDPDWIFPYTMHIDSITPGVIDGHDVNMIWLRGGTGFGQNGTELIYDRFGPQHGFLYYECWGVLDCTPLHLCKYVSDETGDVHIEGSYCDNLPTAISDLSVADGNIHLFPNPATNLLNINLGKSTSIPVDIEVYTISGSLVHSEHTRSPGIQINLTDIAPGMYLCRVISGPRTWVLPFVLQ